MLCLGRNFFNFINNSRFLFNFTVSCFKCSFQFRPLSIYTPRNCVASTLFNLISPTCNSMRTFFRHTGLNIKHIVLERFRVSLFALNQSMICWTSHSTHHCRYLRFLFPRYRVVSLTNWITFIKSRKGCIQFMEE